jgi:hypothetical protein
MDSRHTAADVTRPMERVGHRARVDAPT